MRRILAIPVAVLALTAGSAALAHDSWISRGLFKNTAGEWCCGLGDCFVVAPVQITPIGYDLGDGEVVPFTEALPSADGAFWRCKRPDGSRRCFFAPPPST